MSVIGFAKIEHRPEEYEVAPHVVAVYFDDGTEPWRFPCLTRKSAEELLDHAAWAWAYKLGGGIEVLRP